MQLRWRFRAWRHIPHPWESPPSPSLPKSQSPCGTQGMSHCPMGDLCSLPSQTLHLPAPALCPFTIQPQQGGRGLLLDPSHRQGAQTQFASKQAKFGCAGCGGNLSAKRIYNSPLLNLCGLKAQRKKKANQQQPS